MNDDLQKSNCRSQHPTTAIRFGLKVESSGNGLRDDRMTDIRNWFAHSFRNAKASGGRLDESIFKMIPTICEAILPAMKGIKERLNDALDEIKAWIPDRSNVSDIPQYAQDFSEAEEDLRKRNNRETKTQSIQMHPPIRVNSQRRLIRRKNRKKDKVWPTRGVECHES